MDKELLVNSLFSLFHVLGKVGEVHVALAHESVVEGKGSREVVACLSHLRNLQVVPQQLTIVGVGAVFDDALRTLYWALAAKVGYTLLCDDDVNVVLSVVVVAYHRHDRADGSALGY